LIHCIVRGYTEDGFYIEFDESDTLEVVWVVLMSQLQIADSGDEFVFIRKTPEHSMQVFNSHDWPKITLRNAELSPFGNLVLVKKSDLTEEERDSTIIHVPFLDEPDGNSYLVTLPLEVVSLVARCIF